MKKFLKYLFVTFSGTFLGLFVFLIIVSGIIGGLLISTEQTPEVKDSSILVITFNEQIAEKTFFNPLDKISLNGGNGTTLGLTDIVTSIQQAKNDPKIKGIVLRLNMVQAGYTTVSEIREAILDFRESKKFVYSYADILSQKTYLLASAAEKVYMQPDGVFELTGLSVQRMFFKNLLEKIGLEPILFRAGKFKGAAEIYTQEQFSEENKAQMQEYITDVWDEYSGEISKTRLPVMAHLSDYADELLVWNPQNAKENGFIDDIIYYDEFLNHIKAQLSLKEDADIPQISLANYIQYNGKKSLGAESTVNENKIAVVIAEGNIVMGEGDDSSIGGASLSATIRKIRKDDDVKAIVLRINSGGGSSLASDIIWREVKLAAEAKPLIVSMGDMAASGGYYIAAPATKIVANPTTLTGSIGVWGMSMKANQLFEKIGISVDTVKTNKYSDFGSPVRNMTGKEVAVITQSIDKTYETFKKRVSDGRNIPIDTVETFAQGHIWSGNKALNLGLVDTLGTITTAISIAKQHANLSAYKLETYPKQKDLLELLYKEMGGTKSFEKEMANLVGKDVLEYYKIAQSIPKQEGVYVQVPYLLKID